MKFTVLLFVVAIYITCNVDSQLLQAEEFDCPTDVKLKENDCNKCYCTSEGELACTGYECPQNYGKGIENCNLGTSWLNSCNKCWCITIGQVCTDMDCSIEIK